MIENKVLNVQKIQSHLNAMKVMAQTMLNEADKIEKMLEVNQSKKSIARDKLEAEVTFNYNRRFQKRLQKGENKK